MTDMTEAQRNSLAADLGQRRNNLINMIRAGTADASRDNIQRLGGEVGDPGDVSVALQLADLNLAEVESELREVRAIDSAFERIKDNTYGYCTECHCSIPYARLQAYPTAQRCTDCQTRHEKIYGGRDVTPSM